MSRPLMPSVAPSKTTMRGTAVPAINLVASALSARASARMAAERADADDERRAEWAVGGGQALGQGEGDDRPRRGEARSLSRDDDLGASRGRGGRPLRLWQLLGCRQVFQTLRGARVDDR